MQKYFKLSCVNGSSGRSEHHSLATGHGLFPFKLNVYWYKKHVRVAHI